MLRVAALALGATITIGVFAPQQAAAQSGRQRAEGRGGVIVPQGSRTDGGVYRDDRCYDQGRYDRRNDREDDDRYENEGEHGRGHGKGRKHDDEDRNDSYNRNDNYNNNCGSVYSSRESNGKGPKFCRNGQGHPVYGMAWCRQKGFGSSRGVLSNVGWGDVILRRPRYDSQGDLRYSILQQVLGRTVLGRFNDQRSRLGIDAPLYGRWLETSNGSVLDLIAGGIQIGQILDRNRDGRADVVLMRR